VFDATHLDPVGEPQHDARQHRSVFLRQEPADPQRDADIENAEREIEVRGMEASGEQQRRPLPLRRS